MAQRKRTVSLGLCGSFPRDSKCSDLFRRAAVVAPPYKDPTQSEVIALAYTFMKPVVAATVGGLPEITTSKPITFAAKAEHGKHS